MKKRSLLLLSLITAFCLVFTFGLSACGSNESEEPAETATIEEETTEEVEEYVDGAAYGYTGEDPVEAACYAYMVETIGANYDPADVSIPTVKIIKMDNSPEDETLVYGDFWIENYNIDGETLKCVSGGNYAGCMHVSKESNEVTAFDQVADGGDFEPSAKEIFGDSYEEFAKINSDHEAREELRKNTVADYVKLNGLDVKYYQDEGWDPVELVLE